MANSNFVVQNGLTAGFATIDAASGNIDTSGSVTAASFVGSGAALTGLPAGYTNSDVASYLTSAVGSIGVVTTANTAMKGYTDGQITTVNSSITTANTALKGYTDGQITTVTNSVTGANAAIVTANTAMKGYADAITTAWTANATTQTGQIATVTSAVITANTAMKGYVDDQITTIVGGAPVLLNTLSEIATAIGNDANLSVTLTNTIASKANIASPTFTGTTTVGNITTGNITLGVGSNITSGAIHPISISGQAGTALTVTSNAQPNINSVGTLTSLTVTAAIVGSVTGSAATFTSTTQNSQFNSIGAGTAASATAGEIRATNNITAYYSDRRLKDVVGTIENALAAVNTLSGVRYRANELAGTFGYNTERLEVGVLAQEIQAVLPEIVVPAPFDIARAEDGTEYSKSGENYLTVHYERIVPLLIEAIKGLSAKVAALEAK